MPNNTMAKAAPCQPICHRIQGSFETAGRRDALTCGAGQRRPRQQQLCHTTAQRRVLHPGKRFPRAKTLGRGILGSNDSGGACHGDADERTRIANPGSSAGTRAGLHRHPRAPRALHAGDAHGAYRRRSVARRRIRGDRRHRPDRSRRAAAQWRRANRDAPRGHGRVAGSRTDRPAVRQHTDGNRQYGQDRSGHACLRSRHARDVAHWRGHSPGSKREMRGRGR